MKRLIVFILILGSATAIAQPTSGDIMLEEIDSSQKTTVLVTAPQSFEAVIQTAFKTGSATKLATYFGDNLDLSILGKANLYSRSQAEQVLEHFLAENKAESFKTVHKKEVKTTHYFIGELITKTGKKYRVTINSKVDGTKKSITSLSIEAN